MLIRFLLKGAIVGALGALICVALFGVIGYYGFIAALSAWVICKLVKESRR